MMVVLRLTSTLEHRDSAMYLCMPEVTTSPECGHQGKDMLTNDC